MIRLKRRSTWEARDRELYFNIVQLGAGANGGYSVQHIAQMMSIFGVKGHYLIADPDIVEEKNLANQLFIPKDVGQPKATVLARRYRSHYGVQIAAYSEGFVEDVETLQGLFKQYDSTCVPSRHDVFPILIGAVDNNYTRQVMHEFFMQSHNLLYIDAGVEGVSIPPGHRPKEEWTEEERQRYDESGYSGQVVCGLRMGGKTVLPPLAEKFPDVLEHRDELTPSEMACSQVVASEPQRLITNKFAALTIAAYLNDLFEAGIVRHNVSFFRPSKIFMRSIPAEQLT